jgi:hypothetical protein
MPDSWYEEVEASAKLTQGDMIESCPIVAWTSQPFQPEGREERDSLVGMVDAIEADVIVMTQACDIEQEKVNSVVLCPHLSLTEFHDVWESEMRRDGQNPTSKAWRSYCKRICDGHIWNLTILNAGNCESLTTEHRIVDFHEVYTIPRNFLESLLEQRGRPRLRLLPPYREHLSQAFARYFMRVGLPVGVTPAW